MNQTKDMSKLHDLKRFGQVVKDKFAPLRDYKNGMAYMTWGFNERASIDQIFRLEHTCTRCKKNTELLLDWQEVMHYGRAVSDWKHAYEQMQREAEARQGIVR